jgi:hypothetical protein
MLTPCELDTKVARQDLHGHHRLLAPDAVERRQPLGDFQDVRAGPPDPPRIAVVLGKEPSRRRTHPPRQGLLEPVEHGRALKGVPHRSGILGKEDRIEGSETRPQFPGAGPRAFGWYSLREQDAEKKRVRRGFDERIGIGVPREGPANLRIARLLKLSPV